MSNLILENELTLDPLVRGYAGMNDQEKSDSINTMDRPMPAPIRDVLEYAIRSGVLMKLEDAAVAASSRSKDISRQALALVSHPDVFDSLNMIDPLIIALLQELAVATTITDGERDALLALSDNRRSRASELGLPFTRPGNIENLDY